MLFTLNSGVARVGEDFTYVYEVITLAPGEETCVDIPILDDLLYEGPGESFEVLMTALDLTTSNFSSTSTSVFIVDDDSSKQNVAVNIIKLLSRIAIGIRGVDKRKGGLRYM